MTTTLDDRLVADLASRASGPVITPGQDGYDEARAVHNGLIDRKPALIVRCRSRPTTSSPRSHSRARWGSRSPSGAAGTTSQGARSRTAA